MKIITSYTSIIVGFVFVLGLTSCEDFFIQDLEIPRQDLDQEMVVHSFISDIDTAIEFRVSRNFGLDNLVEEPESRINGATINLFSGGQLLYEIGQNNDGLYRIEMPGVFGYSDQTYRIEVDHPDYEMAMVETTMPPFVEPESVTFKKDGGFANPGSEDKMDLIQITFTDPADQVNYYEFQIHQIQVSYKELIIGQDTFITETRYPDNYFTPDGNFEFGISGFLLSDELINGQTYTIQVMLDSELPVEEIPVEKLRVTWNCLSKDQYEFSKSLQSYQSSAGFGLFSDPVAVYTNVDNGLGVVAFRSSRIYPVEEK